MKQQHIRAAGLCLAILPSLAYAQGTPVVQSGAMTAAHDVPKLTHNGQIQDASPYGVLGDINGRGLNPFAITDSLTEGVCANSAVTTGAYNAVCLGHDASGNGLLTLDSFGGLAAKTLYVRKNGTSYEFPGNGSGNIVGAATTVTGRIPAWGNSAGTLMDAPATAFLDAAGLRIGVGGATVGANDIAAFQVGKVGSALSGFTSSAGYFENDWNGADAQANVYGLYGDLHYYGTTVNQAIGVKGNVYTYPNSGNVLGSFPNQYFNSPNVGTVPYLAGIYGRPAHYLPGTVSHAASAMLDGLYNISTPAGGVVTNFENVLVIPPYVLATNNYVMNILGASCSPTCYTATVRSQSDPIKLSSGTGQSIYLQSEGVNIATFSPVANTANVLSVVSGATGSPVQISAVGDANASIVIAPGNTTGTVKVSTANFQIGTLATPSSAAAACSTGTINLDTAFVYVCTASGAWKRAAIATW